MAEETKIALKLLVHRRTRKVVYAEAKKDFVDVLFGLLQVPVGSIIYHLKSSKIPAPSSLGRVLDSVQNMEATYFHSSAHKETILLPRLVASSSEQTPHNPPLILKQFVSFEEKNTTALSPFGTAPSSSVPREPQLGYLKEGFTFMVTDDLTVSPISTDSLFSMLRTNGIKDIGSLEEKIVNIDGSVVLKLVKASVASDSVLTNVFMRRKGQLRNWKN